MGHGWGTEHCVTLATAAHVLFLAAPSLRISHSMLPSADAGDAFSNCHGVKRGEEWHRVGILLCGAENSKIELTGPGLPDVVSVALAKGFEECASKMLQREDAPTMLHHAPALLAGIRTGSWRFVTTFCETRGFLALLTHKDMQFVYFELERHRFVAGGMAARCMLGALAEAHAREVATFRGAYGSTWHGLARVAAILGHESSLALALPHLPGSWDHLSGGLDKVSSDPAASEVVHESALVRVCRSGRQQALALLLPSPLPPTVTALARPSQGDRTEEGGGGGGAERAPTPPRGGGGRLRRWGECL